MTVFAKSAPSAALAAALLLASPAHAGERSGTASPPVGEFVVHSREKMKAWQERSTRALDRLLANDPIKRTAHTGPGIVQVTFRLGEDGRATDIALHKSTANWASKISAIRAVRMLRTLKDVPVSNWREARFMANIIFANDVAQHRQLARNLELSERARLASGTTESEYIALGR